MNWRDKAKAMIEEHEGRLKMAYKDTLGFLTIGVGRNLDANGLRDDEIDLMLENDIKEAERIARKLVPNFENLSDNRKGVILDLAFNLGETKLAKFINTLRAVKEERWEDAAVGLEQSLWYKQVGRRSKRLVEMMRNG